MASSYDFETRFLEVSLRNIVHPLFGIIINSIMKLPLELKICFKQFNLLSALFWGWALFITSEINITGY